MRSAEHASTIRNIRRAVRTVEQVANKIRHVAQGIRAVIDLASGARKLLGK